MGTEEKRHQFEAAVQEIQDAGFMPDYCELAQAELNAAIGSMNLDQYREILEDSSTSLLDELASATSSLHMILSTMDDRFTVTQMLSAMQDAYRSCDYTSIIDIVHEELARPLIDIPNIAFLKLSPISHILSQNAYPRGLSSALRTLRTDTAYRLAKCEDISYEVSTKRFVEDANPEHKATASEMNVICAGAEMMQALAEGEREIFSETELMNFMTKLEDSPTSASQTVVGRKIISLIESRSCIDFDRDVYFHARHRKEKECPYTHSQMLTAPSGVTGPGRFNYPGRAYYYFSDTKDGAQTEIRKHIKGGCIQIARVRPVKPVKLLDLSGTLPGARAFLKYIRFDVSDMHSQMPREYLIPNYVSDWCRELGIEGIKYQGSSKYANYVCWNDGYFAFDGMENETIE